MTNRPFMAISRFMAKPGQYKRRWSARTMATEDRLSCARKNSGSHRSALLQDQLGLTTRSALNSKSLESKSRHRRKKKAGLQGRFYDQDRDRLLDGTREP